MALGDHDKSALHRQLLGDLAALISVREYLAKIMRPGMGAPARVESLDEEISTLIKELWP